MEKIVIELKDGENRFKVVGTIRRVPQPMGGWDCVFYQGRRYQLLGGIRNNVFINIKHPRPQRGPNERTSRTPYRYGQGSCQP